MVCMRNKNSYLNHKDYAHSYVVVVRMKVQQLPFNTMENTELKKVDEGDSFCNIFCIFHDIENTEYK